MPTRRALLVGLAGSALAYASAARDGSGPTGDLLGSLRWHLTEETDTLLDIAVANDVGILAISAANPGVDPWVPGADRLILLPTAHILPEGPREGILINKAELGLYWFPKGRPVRRHAIGVGRDGYDTPVGETRVVRKQKDPTWYPTPRTRAERPELPAVVPPGPDNPLGRHALYLGWPTYLIHGTNKPYGVGRRVSRGCIRMYPYAIERLYDEVAIGTRVTVVDQQVKAGWHEGELYLEAHPDLGQLEELEENYSFTPRPGEVDEASLALVRRKAGAALARVDWDRVEAELVARRGIPVRITRPEAPAPPEDAWEEPVRPVPEAEIAPPVGLRGLY
ncbi:MAG: L,D-transpeptidase family protein [Geminicoccaceae bacterium]|nr:L,D-transpeptidase family protein [Geminicoccaceae bacterium]MCS7269384.1 L,D-transpeptidase family protein [Geminicoccaceae bacterium]MDW8126046.1 L,D-transpeptidase family protein [Geminicoccaceae bacterium]MDW8340990.1 L,D-transpeptidase family protein [Geminicoccaceae bacterium]